MTENYFNELNSIDVKDKIEKKNGLSYLSWAWAWGELKKRHPNATYTVYENANGLNYHTDGNTAWVKTGVTVNDIEHIEYLPIMDYKNKSIPVGNITSFDVNKAIQRSLTKAVARHGLGLYIYAGEDLPEQTIQTIETKKPKPEEDISNDFFTEEETVENLEELIDLCESEDALKSLYKENKKIIMKEEYKNLLDKITEKRKELKKKVA
jgi:hypothetical protein